MTHIEPTEEELAFGLIDGLLGLAATLRAELAAAVTELGLTEAQAGLLWALDPDRPPPQMSDLAGLRHCDPSSVTSLVGGLERRGLVERRPSAHDQRVREVCLTAEGRGIRRRLTKVAITTPLARLSAAQQRQLLALLTRATDRS